MARAVDADKLGGYAASAYLRKDEVEDVKSSYETVEWGVAGTNTWVVPQGVTKLKITTVGGGGGTSYYVIGNNNIWFNYNLGGGGGAVLENRILDVKGGDTITVVVGAGGAQLANFPYEQYVNGVYGMGMDRSKQASGIRGTSSYVKKNGATVAATIADGGYPGQMSYNLTYYQGVPYYQVYGGAPGGPGGGRGGNTGMWLYTNAFVSTSNGSDGVYGKGGQSFKADQYGNNYIGSTKYYPGTTEGFCGTGGGGSYGVGGSCENQPTRGGGGGGCPGYTNQYHQTGASGYVKIDYIRMYSD